MGLVKILKSLAAVSNIIYLLGWLLALIGLSYQQNWCKDHVEEASSWVGLGLTASQVGSKCNKLYRFAWFVWALSTVPLLLSVVHNVRPHLVARGSGALFAILAVLQILLANEFFNLDDRVRETGTGTSGVDGVSDTISTNDTLRDWVRVTLAGFAIMAAAALMTIIFEALTDPNKSRHEHSSGDHDQVGGRYDHGSRHEAKHDSPREARTSPRETRVPVGGRVVDAVPVVTRNEPAVGTGVVARDNARYV